MQTERPLRMMQLETVYDYGLDDFYARNPNLANLSFDDQLQALIKSAYTSIHSIALYLKDLGYETFWTIANCKPLQLQWAREHNIVIRNPENWLYEVSSAQVEFYTPDVLFFFNISIFDYKFIRSLHFRPRLVVGWRACDIPINSNYSEYDLVLSGLQGVQEAARSLGAKATDTYFPGFQTWIYEEIKDYSPTHDLSFCGQWTPAQHRSRNELLHKIAVESQNPPQFSCAYYIGGRPDLITPEVARFNNGPRFGLDMFRAIRSGRIGLDARSNMRLLEQSGTGKDIAGDETVNMRIFETAGCGVFLLTEHYENVRQFFEIGKEIVTFRNEKELFEKIRYYLAHPQEREDIARRGRERCLRDHSMEKRARVFDEIIRKHLKTENQVPKSDITLDDIRPMQMPIVSIPETTGKANLERINRLIANKEFSAAKNEIDQASLLDPADPELIVARGTLLLQQEDIENARREFVKATILAPRFALGHSMLGLVLVYMERFREAEQALQRALELNPNDQNANTMLQGVRNKLNEKTQPFNEPVIKNRMQIFIDWISTLALTDRRLYYRDQTPESLNALVEMVQTFKPSRVVELGTLSGLSLRTWLMADERLKVTAIDLSFKPLFESQKIIPLDLTRVTLVEQDIMTIDFSRLWTADERVLFYIDAHDLPGVPIMDYVLHQALPILPPGSVVAVDDLWYSATTLSQSNVLDFYDRVVVPQFDPIYYAVLNYAPYWEQGSFVGFPEVIPFMKWLSQNQIHLTIKPKVKMVHFAYPQSDYSGSSLPTMTSDSFLRQVGQVMRNPVANYHVHNQHLPEAQQATVWCQNGEQAFEKGHIGETSASFERALAIHPAISGAYYAQAVCLARQGQFDAALQYLHVELNNSYPAHPRAKILQQDINDWLRMEKQAKKPEAQFSKKNDVTIFASPKPFKDLAEIIQHNAITSWTKLDPRPDVILFGEEEGNQEISSQLGLKHIVDIQRTQFGTPIVSSIFNLAQQSATTDTCMYINADIILLGDLQSSIQKVKDKFEKYLIVGQRWDIDIPQQIVFDHLWESNLRQKIKESGKIHSPAGIDYFIFSKGSPFDDIPPFVLGRPAWDNWVIYHALEKNIPVIDATEEILAVHQNHDYSHSAGAKSGPEVDHNRQLAQGYISVRSSTDATWCFIDGKVVVSPYAFPELAVNQKSQPEYAARLLQQGNYFNQNKKFARALSCLEEAERNYKQTPGLSEALQLSRDGLRKMQSIASITDIPAVSVIIPTYNRGDLISRAIKSVRNQTYTDIEIIVVDDGSKDDTESIVKEIARTDNRVKYTRHRNNRGAQAARNTGIRAARGKWITFLDSDDEYLPQKIERQLNTAIKEKTLAVYCECYKQEGSPETRTVLKTKGISGNIYAEALRGSPITFPGLFVAKECFEKIDFLDENVPSFQELDTTIRLAKQFSFSFVPAALFIYYRNVTSAISDNLKGNAKGWEYIVNKHADEILKVTGRETLAAHYQEISRRYSLAGMSEKASQYQMEIHKLFNQPMQMQELAVDEIKSVDEWVQQGINQYRGGDLKGAEYSLLQAFKLAPGNANIHISLGMIYLATSQFQDAQDHFMEAVKINAADVDGWIGLSKAARVFNNQKLLSRSLEMIRMLDPNNAELKQML